MRAGIKNTFPLIILAVFVVGMALLLIKASKENSTKYIRAIGYPKDTIMAHGKSLLVIEIHDFVKDTVYNDTIKINRRMPSTLEDFDPKYRDFRERKYN